MSCPWLLISHVEKKKLTSISSCSCLVVSALGKRRNFFFKCMYVHCSFLWLINTAGIAPRLNPQEKKKTTNNCSLVMIKVFLLNPTVSTSSFKLKQLVFEKRWLESSNIISLTIYGRIPLFICKESCVLKQKKH